MQQRNLGPSGLRVSVVGLGCNNFGGRTGLEDARKVIDRAIEVGITLFDTADIYGNRGGSETILGEVLGKRRDQIVLATKFGGAMDEAGTMKGGSRRYIMAAVEASLRRLRTDWIDLYQMHFADPLTPMDETLRALDDLVRAGKVRYVGLSNHTSWQVVDAQWRAKTLGTNAFIACQDEYSLVVRGIERELIPAMRAQGLGLLPYFPLASGLLTGKYRAGQPLPAGTRLAGAQNLADRYLTEQNVAAVEHLRAFCEARGISMLELAFGWLAAQPVVTSVIAGATKPEQVAQNAQAVSWTPTAEDLAEIDRLTGT